MILNTLIEKVLYIPPDCAYSNEEFVYPCLYTEMCHSPFCSDTP